MHETAEEAMAETEQMLNVYADFCENDLAIPVIKGRKTDKEKFAGAEATYTIEAMMHDGKALQSGTSHYFGDGFARAFGITFTGRDNSHPVSASDLLGHEHPHHRRHHHDPRRQQRPGTAARCGADPGDDYPDRPAQGGRVGEGGRAAGALEEGLPGEAWTIPTQSPGWKFAQYEMKGVPLRLEIGPKDIEKNQCVLVRRTDREKVFVPLDQLETAIAEQLEIVRNNDVRYGAGPPRVHDLYGHDAG